MYTRMKYLELKLYELLCYCCRHFPPEPALFQVKVLEMVNDFEEEQVLLMVTWEEEQRNPLGGILEVMTIIGIPMIRRLEPARDR